MNNRRKTFHSYAENGYQEIQPDGSRSVGETCRKCGFERVVSYDASGIARDRWLAEIEEEQSLILPPPGCPPGDQWQEAAALIEEAADAFELVVSARAVLRKAVSEYKQAFDAAEAICDALAAPTDGVEREGTGAA